MLKKFFLIAIFTLGFGVRLYKIDGPIADWHSFRQADTASVTRNFISQGINLFNPTYHDLSNIQSGQENPLGFRFVELPLYNALSALAYQTIKFSNITPEITQRLLSIFLSLGSGLLIFFITRKISKSYFSAIFATLLFLFLPFNIFYSRSILPEPMAVFFMLLSLYFITHQRFVSASIPLAFAILIKPYTAILLLPIIIFFLFHKSYLINQKKRIFLFSILSLSPFILWRLWISRHPEGIPASDWLFNGGEIRFRPAWFRWLFSERLAKLILGSFGLIPLFLGFAYKKDNSQKTLLLLSVGIILYFSIIARGNIQHDYYQVLIIPFISIIAGIGFNYIYHFLFSQKYYGLFAALILFIATISFSWYEVRGYYNINNPVIVEAGTYADKSLPSNATIIAPYTGDTAFLYQTHRSGWPTEIYDVPKIKQLVSPRPVYFLSVNYDDYTNSMIKKYQIMYQNERFVLLDLNQ